MEIPEIKIPIDLGKLFYIEKVSLFLEFDSKRRSPAISMPLIAERLLNSCSFASSISVEESSEMRCGLVRASISELVSLEELPVVAELNSGNPYRLSSTSHPLLCLIKELRNVQMHLSSIEMSESEKDMLLGNPDKPEDARKIVRRICFIDNLKLDQFESLRNYKKYSSSDFSEALEWFDSEQRRWGISELLRQAAYLYAESLSNLIDAKKS